VPNEGATAALLARGRDAAVAPPGPVRRLAVVDVGSNTARLVIYEAPEGGMPRVLLERKEVPRLGQGVGHGGRLHPAAIERGVASLRRFATTIQGLGAPVTVAVATSAVRDAADGPAFIARASEASGLALRVLSGEEEARYSYLGVASAWELGDDRVVDLGGGSLQVATVRRGAFRSAVSLPLGALRLTEEFLAHDPPKPREVDELRGHVRDFLAEAFPPRPEGDAFEIHGVGGTIRTLARVAIGLKAYPIARVHGYALHRRDLEALLELLGDLPVDKRREVPGIGGERADVIVAGLATVLELVRAAGVPYLRVSGMGIREGIAAEALGLAVPVPAEALLRRSAITARRTLGSVRGRDEELARRAGELFDLLGPREGWGVVERRALLAAALFHDVGASIDLWGHARHAAYLLRNYPLVGLDHRELLVAALTAYQHEGDEATPTMAKELRAIGEKDDLRTARKLGALVYAAETLDDEGVKLHVSGDRTLVVTLSADGARELAPRALGRVRKPLKRSFDVDVEIHGARE